MVCVLSWASKRWVFKSYRYNSLENSLGICIYTIYSDDNSWYGLWWFVFPESAKHEFYHSLENSLGTCTFCFGLWWFVYCPDAWASKRGVGLSPPFLSLTQLCWPNLHTSLNIYFPYIYFPYICVSLYVFPIYIYSLYIFPIYMCPWHTSAGQTYIPWNTIKYKTDSQTWKSVK